MAIALPAEAHETDQYTMPSGREFADLANYLTRYFYNAIENGVEKQNKRIEQASRYGGKEFAQTRSADELASAVNRQFPIALVVIDSLDKMSTAQKTRLTYPGKIVGYKNTRELRKHVELPLNPFNAWQCATIQAYGVTFGTDKVGHFTDMGMHYYRAFRKAKDAGASDDTALKSALELGTHNPIYSERGLLGLASAGAYSNADLVANFMGMCFYRNLTEPVMLKGQTRPPMVVRKGDYWRVADHVRPDSDFFSSFISDHWNEALNPSFYKESMRKGIRKSILAHRKDLIARYCDPNGNSWSPERFEQETRELFTYWGVDYGHLGDKELMTVARTCFDKAPDMNDPSSRNADGLTPMHFAAAQDDVAALERLIAAGADANARVVSANNAPAVSGDTPLHLAAKDGRLDAAKVLLARGADPDAVNDRGDTPLHMAVEFPRMVELLIQRRADVNVQDEGRRSPLHWAARNPLASAAVQILLNAGAHPQPVDRDGQTPLHDAARAANTNAIIALLKGGADVDAADRMGITPLHLAAADGGAAVSDLLVQAGADVNARDDFGCTPLLAATRKGQTQVVAALLQHKADPNLADAYGKTAVAAAGERRYQSIAQLLAPHAAPDAQTAAQRQPPAKRSAPTLSHGR